MPVGDRYVMFRGGLAVPVAPVQLLFQLDGRGFELTRDGDDLVIKPSRCLTRGEREQVRRWKRHLLALVEYEPPQMQ